MLTLFALWLIFSSFRDLRQIRYDEIRDNWWESRNREIEEEIKEKLLAAEKRPQRKIRRRIVKDTDGRITAEEVIIEDISDDDYDNWDDDLREVDYR